MNVVVAGVFFKLKIEPFKIAHSLENYMLKCKLTVFPLNSANFR